MSTLAERATEQLRRLTKQHGVKTRLAKELNIVPSAITPYLDGKREVTLRMLDALCVVTDTRPGEILASPDSELRDLDPVEAGILRSLRSRPRAATEGLGQFLRLFAGEHAERDQSFQELYRSLDKSDQDMVLTLATRLRATALAQKVEATAGGR